MSTDAMMIAIPTFVPTYLPTYLLSYLYQPTPVQMSTDAMMMAIQILSFDNGNILSYDYNSNDVEQICIPFLYSILLIPLFSSQRGSLQ